MVSVIKVIFSSFRTELIKFTRSPFLIVLVLLQAITFLILVTLFGMTGAFAPTAIIDYDKGEYSKDFIRNLDRAYHSFSLKPMDDYRLAMDQIKKGDLVSIIMIPFGFTAQIKNGRRIPVIVTVDNIDTDMSADIQRALPAAIAAFAKDHNLPGIQVRSQETDLINHDTDFIVYMVVSALILGAFVISGILGAMSTAGEFESKTVDFLKVAPVSPVFVFLGKMIASGLVSLTGTIAATFVAIYGWDIHPAHPFSMMAILAASILLFGLIGCAIGTIMKKTLPAVTFIFGISLPLYLFSGTYEPERFDGNLIWGIAHFTPVYYAVGIIEKAVLDLQVTPESILTNYLALLGWAALAILVIRHFLKKNFL